MRAACCLPLRLLLADDASPRQLQTLAPCPAADVCRFLCHGMPVLDIADAYFKMMMMTMITLIQLLLDKTP